MKRSNENGMAWIACQDAVHCIKPSQMQVIESSKILMFSFVLIFLLTALVVGMLAREVPNATC